MIWITFALAKNLKMKNYFFLAATTIFIAAACNQADTKSATKGSDSSTTALENTANALADSASYTSIEWIDSIHQELGKIKEGEVPEIAWRFKNTGDKPLVVINAAGTCGCTVAEKPEQPVAPGETGVIKAKFSSEGRIGPNNKQVVVTTNTKENTTTALGFTVTVEKQ